MKTINRTLLTQSKRMGLCAAIAALAIGIWPATTAHMQGESPLPTPPPPTALPPTTSPLPAPRPAQSTAAPKLVTRRIQETDAKAPYDIDVKYPAVSNPTDAWLGFNAIAEAQAQDLIAAFKKDVAAMGTFTATAYPTNTLASAWQPFRITRDFVSVRSTVSAYASGAAHPNSFTRVINYDPRTGTDLALADLFKPSADYLKALSAYCTRILKRRGVLDFPEGAEPKPENYANWNMGRNNLVITFDPYLVAPYAAGPQECQVPLSTLRRLFAEPRRW